MDMNSREEEEEDSEHSYVYCTYEPVQPDEKDLEIAELKRRIIVLKRERDEYKRRATLYGNLIERKKREERSRQQFGTDERDPSFSLPRKQKWISMTNKIDWTK